MKIALTWVLVSFLWALHWLPIPLLRAFGWVLGMIAFPLAKERREVALINLRLCFPELGANEIRRLARAHFVSFCRAVIDRPVLWWGSRRRIERLIRVQGMDHVKALAGRPVILLCPHFVGLDAAGTRLNVDLLGCTVYSKPKNPVLDWLFQRGRSRFNPTLMLSRQDGLRRIVKAIGENRAFYYLPDQDFGPKESIFVPFFGVQAATIPALSRLVRLTGAAVLPVIAFQRPDGYDVEVQPPWEGFPGESVEADTVFMNRFIESQVLRMPEQYFWLHKRFKTRPPGEQRFYK